MFCPMYKAMLLKKVLGVNSINLGKIISNYYLNTFSGGNVA